MDARIPLSSSWIIKRILELRDVVQQYQVEWNTMLTLKKFKMNLLYDAICAGNDFIEWRFLFQHNDAKPRSQFISWLICHGKLATKDRLFRFNMISNNTYRICNAVEESIPLLFFECRSNASIWQQVLIWMKSDHHLLHWLKELKCILKATSKKGCEAKVLKIAFTETLYGIYNRRNDIVFKHNSQIDIVHNIIDSIVYRSWHYRKIKSYISQLML